MHASIGQLNNGKFYAYLHGYHNDPTFRESVAALEALLAGEPEPVAVVVGPKTARTVNKTYDVAVTFQHPAWNMVDGIEYKGIPAQSKSEANDIARSKAERDGQLGWGQGRVTFKATEV